MTASQACRPPSGNSGSSSTPATETIFSSVGFSAIDMVEALAGVDMTGWRKEKETQVGIRPSYRSALRGKRQGRKRCSGEEASGNEEADWGIVEPGRLPDVFCCSQSLYWPTICAACASLTTNSMNAKCSKPRILTLHVEVH